MASQGVNGPVAKLGGAPYLLARARPGAPTWFADALAVRPERTSVPVDGCDIELLTWGDTSAPGLMFLHGNAAHADWWSFIAPFFAQEFRVAALSWSGMGRSGWRPNYDIGVYVEEIMQCADAAGLFSSSERPTLVGHSFGASPMLECLAAHGDSFSLGIAVDKGVPLDDSRRNVQRREWSSSRRLFPSLELGLARFRLSPPQLCDNLYLVDHIARRSLQLVHDAESGLDGWSWTFDPALRGAMGMAHAYRTLDLIRSSRASLAFLYGANSALVTEDMKAAMKTAAREGSYFETIAGAGHHVMLDQPLALIDALRRCLGQMGVGTHQSLSS